MVLYFSFIVLLRFQTTELANEDLDKYYKALDRCVSFHYFLSNITITVTLDQ